MMERLLKSTSVTGSSMLSESSFFTAKNMVKTSMPILNIAFSGEVDGGFAPGITVLSGDSKTFKSALSLFCLKAYLDKYDDAIGILYDTEYGITPDYVKSFGIDPTRVIHIPVEHVEQLKFDFVKKLEEINKGDHVFFLVDSIGQISSKKETDDAHDEKSVADMTRAKAIRSLLRLITIQLTKKELPCFLINHVYVEIGAMYPKTIIPGGTAMTYSANQIFVITKSQEKGTDGELDGWKFTINVHKSRGVKEKSKLPFQVMYESGIQRYSGIFDIALEGGFIQKPKQGWYAYVNPVTGEVSDKNFRAKEFDELYAEKIISSDQFREYVKKEFKLSTMVVDLDEPSISADDLDDAE
jgi:RecA/RadA recombinase